MMGIVACTMSGCIVVPARHAYEPAPVYYQPYYYHPHYYHRYYYGY
ncbi:hypothetical protein [Bordetella genomosp. 13]|nr:hypothetical protein [Bordetella genomosp. 13]